MPKSICNVYFSLIIPNWNGKVHLKECLDSVGWQTFTDFEAILVDNGSTDGSLDYAKVAFPEVRILPLPDNVGFAAGVNYGIEAAQGQFIVLLNNDTEVDPDWLKNLHAATREHPEIAIFASKLLNYYTRNTIDSAGDAVHLRSGPYKIGEGDITDKYSERSVIFGACGGGGCYRRELFDQIGCFDEDFFAYFEDVDLSFRANWAGFRCMSVPEAVIYHKVGGTSDTSPASKDRFDIMRRRNFIFLVIKNYPALFLWKYSPYILTVHCLLFLVNLLRGRFRVAFMTQWEIYKGLPGMIKKRKMIISTRRITDKEMLSRCLPESGGWTGFAKKKLASVLVR